MKSCRLHRGEFHKKCARCISLIWVWTLKIEDYSCISQGGQWVIQGMLTHWGWVTHICISKLSHHCFKQWHVPCMVPSHYLNQCWIIVNWTIANKFQWNFYCNSNIFSEENMFENVVCKIMLSILSQLQCKPDRYYVWWCLGSLFHRQTAVTMLYTLPYREGKLFFFSLPHCMTMKMASMAQTLQLVLFGGWITPCLAKSLRPSDEYMHQ